MTANPRKDIAAALRALALAIESWEAEPEPESTDVNAERPALLDRSGLAMALGLSLHHVDRMRAEGCPRLRVGDVERFQLNDMLDWLRARESAAHAGARESEFAVMAKGSTPEPTGSADKVLPKTRKSAKALARVNGAGGLP